MQAKSTPASGMRTKERRLGTLISDSCRPVGAEFRAGAGGGGDWSLIGRPSSFVVHPDAVVSFSAIAGKKETGRGESRGRFGRSGYFLPCGSSGPLPPGPRSLGGTSGTFRSGFG